MKKRVERTHWKVLLAEDNDDHALLIQMALERASRIPVEVHRARNGDEAIVLVEDIVPDLILLDLKMPGRTGLEVLEAIKGDDEFRRISQSRSSRLRTVTRTWRRATAWAPTTSLPRPRTRRNSKSDFDRC